MTNVSIKKQNSALTIVIDLSQEHGPSKSGKTVIIAKTPGAVDVGDGVKLNLQCYRSKSIV